MPRILIVDDEPAIRDLLTLHLSKKYNTLSADSGYTGLELCDKEHFDLVIADINMPGMSGPELLSVIRKSSPETILVLMTGYDINNYIDLARRYGFSNIIAKTVPFNFPEMDIMIESLLSGAIFGLKRYLQSDGEILESRTIRSSAEARQVREEIVAIFMQRFGIPGDMNLLLDEALTNALYHAATIDRGPAGDRDFPEVTLQEKDYITVEAGFDAQKYGVSVTDNSGLLTRETVLERLSRQLSGAGTMDPSGRGMHISRIFSDRMIVNIKRQSKTEVILMNYFKPHYRGFKPLYINEL